MDEILIFQRLYGALIMTNLPNYEMWYMDRSSIVFLVNGLTADFGTRL